MERSATEGLQETPASQGRDAGTGTGNEAMIRAAHCDVAVAIRAGGRLRLAVRGHHRQRRQRNSIPDVHRDVGVAAQATAPTAHARRAAQPRPGVLARGRARRLDRARFSETFLVLRAHERGVPAMWIPSVLVVMSVVYTLSAYPAGKLSDAMPRRRLLAWGMAVLLLADVLLAKADGYALLFAGISLWGLHMGLTQGILASLVADTAPTELRGTAFGAFNLVSGAALLAASALAGWLRQAHGPAATFWCGAAISAISLPLLILVARGD